MNYVVVFGLGAVAGYALGKHLTQAKMQEQMKTAADIINNLAMANLATLTAQDPFDNPDNWGERL
jgi:uncharacterized protein YjaZ